MKKLMIVMGLAVILVKPVLAFQPAGWIYFNYPWAYENDSKDWYWFSTDNTQWVVNMGNNQWAKLQNSALASGWVYFTGSFAYAQGNSAWHWVNDADTQWVVNMRTGAWSRFGQAGSPGQTSPVFPVGGTLAAFNDFNGDGAADLAVYNPDGGKWYARTLGGATIAWEYVLGDTSSVAVPADYNGDGRTDFAVYNTTTGAWRIKTLEGDTLVNGYFLGGTGFVPVPGDYDGDGNADIGVYELSTGNWTIWSFAKGEALFDDFNWGFAGDVRGWENPPTSTVIPVPFDYDQDGTTDLAVYYRGVSMETTVWYIRGSAGVNWFPSEHWGSSGSIPAPGRYRDVVDPATYPAGMTVYKVKESPGVGDDGTMNTPYMYQIKIGAYGRTLPVAGHDFDGNGWDDHAVYDYTTGDWTVFFNDGDGNANQEGTAYQPVPSQQENHGFAGAVPANIYSSIYTTCNYSVTPW